MAIPQETHQKTKLIAVAGPTGAGKTSFINLVAGSSLEVGNSLRSCTSGVQTVQCIVAGEQVTFIDTPGFDDTYKSQADILKDIADFLEQTYEGGRKLTGVIYMHRISDVRVGGIARENFRLFKKICGRGAMKNVVIVTTMWDEVPEEVGVRREQELASKSLFFKDALDDGAKMHRHCGQITTAQTSMSPFLRFLPETLQLQRELVDEMRVLPETTAGDELQRSLDEQADAHRRQMLDLYDRIQRAWASRADAHSEEVRQLREEYASLQSRLALVEEDVRKIKRENRHSNSTFRKTLARVKLWSRLRGARKAKSPDGVVILPLREGSGCLGGGVEI